MKVTTTLLSRNTLLNLTGQLVPLIVGVVSMPVIVRTLGTERFGILAIAWVVLGYFAVFDLGVGRATTKYVAAALGKGIQEEVSRLIWTAVVIQAFLGLAGGILLASLASWLSECVLSVDRELVDEMTDTLRVLAFAVPLILLAGSFSALLQAAQRFDLDNAVKIPLSSLIFLIPLLGSNLGLGLAGLVAIIVASKLAGLLALMALSFRVFPGLRRFSGHASLLPRLLRYGSWATITSLVGPILTYLDRFLIASLLSVSAAGYYAAPYEGVSRLCIIPASITMTLFPVFSILESSGEKQKLEVLFSRSLKYVLLALAPAALLLMLHAKDILRIWLGDDFAAQGHVVLRVLAFGVLINSLAHVPFALLQGMGRPDIPAKFHLVELPFYVGLALFSIGHWGIAGGAVAWTVRVAVDACLLFIAAFKVCRLRWRLFADGGVIRLGQALFALAATTCAAKGLAGSLTFSCQLALFGGVVVVFGSIVWKKVLDKTDRMAILGVAKLGQRSERV
jgi:O-antigen/teichoic acid export membrane protein